MGRLEEAIASYDRAIALRADLTAAHANRGNALAALGRHEAAVDSFDRALATEEHPGVGLSECGEPAIRGLLGGSRVELVDREELGAKPAPHPIVVALEGVHEASIEGRKLRSRVASGARAIPSILSALEAQGIGVEAVTTHRPSLDDV